MDNNNSIVAELIALSNSKGGIILFGIEDKTGAIKGLDYEQLQSYNNRIASIANDKIKPQIFFIRSAYTPNGRRRKENVEEGIAKPYKDKNGIIWIKQGSDKEN